MCTEALPGISANQWYRGTFDSDMFCLLKPREPTVRELRPKNLDGLNRNYGGLSFYDPEHNESLYRVCRFASAYGLESWERQNSAERLAL